MTIKKKLIGYGYTDSNGVATLDYDENGTEISTLAPTGNSGYIGKGVGSVQLGAGLHSSEAVVSETSSVWDTLFHDVDSTGNDNSKWIYSAPLTELVAEEDCKLIDCTKFSSSYSICGCNGTSGTTWSWNNLKKFSKPFAIEFKVVDVDYTSQVAFYFGQTQISSLYGMRASINDTVKLTVEDNKVYGSVNGGTKTELGSIASDTSISFAFRVNSTHYFRFKDFKIYSI